jgi:guanine deaminase
MNVANATIPRPGATCAAKEDATTAVAIDAAAISGLVHSTVQEAVKRAAQAVATGQPGLFTSAIVSRRDGTIMAWGCNRVLDTCDPTAHSEIVAIRRACQEAESVSLTAFDAVLCCNAEPCPMCLVACHWAGLRAVYYACPKERVKEVVGFDDASLYADLARPADARQVLCPTVHVACCAADAPFQLWKAREGARPTTASLVSPSARAALANTATAPTAPPGQQLADHAV